MHLKLYYIFFKGTVNTKIEHEWDFKTTVEGKIINEYDLDFSHFTTQSYTMTLKDWNVCHVDYFYDA